MSEEWSASCRQCGILTDCRSVPGCLPAHPGGTRARLLPRSLAAAISLLKRLAMDSGTSLLLSEAAPSPGVLLRSSDSCRSLAAHEHHCQWQGSASHVQAGPSEPCRVNSGL